MSAKLRMISVVLVVLGTLAVCSTVPAAVKAGTNFAIEEYLENELQPAVAYGNGEFLVVHSYEFSADDHDIWARLVGVDGSLGSELEVDRTVDDSLAPAVAYDPDDERYLVVWQNLPDGGSDDEIYGALLNGAGEIVVSAFVIGTSASEDLSPAAAYVGSGVFVVCWARTTDPATVPDGSIRARTVSATGTLGTEKLVSSQARSINPQIAAIGGGYSVVMWQHPFSTAGGLEEWDWDVAGRVLDFTASGVGAGAGIAETAAPETNPSAAYSTTSDELLVVWQARQSAADHDIVGALVTAETDGTITPAEAISIEDSAYKSQRPRVCWSAGVDEFFTAWSFPYTGDVADMDVRGKAVTNGGAVGAAVELSQALENQQRVEVAWGWGTYLAVWEDLRTETDYDIYGQRMTDEGQVVISGYVSTQTADGVEGVTMMGLPGNPVTNSDGLYTSVLLPSGWSGTVTPAKGELTFAPANRVYSGITQDQTDQDYEVTTTYMISGHVWDEEGAGFPDVTLEGLPGNPVTGADGYYTATVPYGWSGIVEPVRAGFAFTPASVPYMWVESSMADEDYTIATMSVRATDGSAVPGGTDTIDVLLEGVPVAGANVAGFSVTLTFDQGVLEQPAEIDVTLGPSFGGGASVVNVSTPGEVSVGFVELPGPVLTADAVLFSVEFTVNDPPSWDNTALHIDGVEATDDGAQFLPVMAASDGVFTTGTVIVPENPEVAVGEWLHFRCSPSDPGDLWSLTQAPSGGSIDQDTGVYQAGATGAVIDEVTVLSGGSTPYSTDVTVTTTPRGAGVMGPYTSMDLNGGGVGVPDVILMLRITVGLDEPTVVQVRVADFNLNGVVDISDVINALRVAVGLAPMV